MISSTRTIDGSSSRCAMRATASGIFNASIACDCSDACRGLDGLRRRQRAASRSRQRADAGRRQRRRGRRWWCCRRRPRHRLRSGRRTGDPMLQPPVAFVGGRLGHQPFERLLDGLVVECHADLDAKVGSEEATDAAAADAVRSHHAHRRAERLFGQRDSLVERVRPEAHRLGARLGGRGQRTGVGINVGLRTHRDAPRVRTCRSRRSGWKR